MRFHKKTGTAVIASLLLSASMLTGCSVLGDYSGDTCDGRKPVGSLEKAGQDLVTAVYAGDQAGVCRVTSPFDGGTLNEAMISQTKEILGSRGITPENVAVIVGENFGSGVAVTLTNGSNDKNHAIDVGGIAVREAGFTIGLPHEVYPDLPEDSASESAAATQLPD